MNTTKAQTQPTIIDRLRQRQTYLKTTELMEILGTTRETLCRWVREGILPAYRIGKDNLFDPAIVVRFLEERAI